MTTLSIAQEVNNLRSGGTPYRILSLGTTGQVVRNTAGEVVFMHVMNTHASAWAYLKLYNKATAPTDSDTPVYTLALAPANAFVLSLVRGLGGFSAGIGARATLNAADGDTNAPTSAVVVNLAHVAA